MVTDNHHCGRPEDLISHGGVVEKRLYVNVKKVRDNIAALAVILTFGGFLLLVVRAGGRITRWYINQPLRQTQLPGDPLAARMSVPPPIAPKATDAEQPPPTEP